MAEQRHAILLTGSLLPAPTKPTAPRMRTASHGRSHTLERRRHISLRRGTHGRDAPPYAAEVTRSDRNCSEVGAFEQLLAQAEPEAGHSTARRPWLALLVGGTALLTLLTVTSVIGIRVMLDSLPPDARHLAQTSTQYATVLEERASELSGVNSATARRTGGADFNDPITITIETSVDSSIASAEETLADLLEQADNYPPQSNWTVSYRVSSADGSASGEYMYSPYS